ncbi:MAG: type VI secretion protein, partial [Acidimicrobiales bacterium]
MPHDHVYDRGPRPRPGGGGGSGGIPDGLLIGVLGLLLALTVLTWTATGLAGLLAHGSWPEGVTFTRTPMAIRALAAEPHDIAGAWPDARPSHLSGYGLVWGLLISQLLLAVVLTVFVLGTLARARAVHAAHRERRSRLTERTGAADDDVRAQPAPTKSPPPENALSAPREAPSEPPPIPHPTAEPAPAPAPAPVPAPGAAPAPDSRSRAHEAAGALLVATSDPTLWAATKDARAKLGPVHL